MAKLLRMGQIGRLFKRNFSFGKKDPNLYHHPIDYIIDPKKLPSDTNSWSRFLCVYICPPAIIGYTVYIVYDMSHELVRRPEFKPFGWRQQVRDFPWGDGKHSLLFNPKVNATLDGYEDEITEDDTELNLVLPDFLKIKRSKD